jgi:hypothetical protein
MSGAVILHPMYAFKVCTEKNFTSLQHGISPYMGGVQEMQYHASSERIYLSIYEISTRTKAERPYKQLIIPHKGERQ